MKHNAEAEAIDLLMEVRRAACHARQAPAPARPISRPISHEGPCHEPLPRRMATRCRWGG